MLALKCRPSIRICLPRDGPEPLELSASVPQIFPNDPVGMGREGGLASVEVVPSTGRGE